MRDREVSLGALQRAIGALGQQYSDQRRSRITQTSRERTSASWPSSTTTRAIGKALSNNRQALGVELVSTAGGNAHWAKAGGSSQAQAAEPVGSVMLASDIGPQFAG